MPNGCEQKKGKTLEIRDSIPCVVCKVNNVVCKRSSPHLKLLVASGTFRYSVEVSAEFSTRRFSPGRGGVDLWQPNLKCSHKMFSIRRSDSGGGVI